MDYTCYVSYIDSSTDYSHEYYDPNSDRNKWYQSRSILGRASATMEPTFGEFSSTDGIIEKLIGEIELVFEKFKGAPRRREITSEEMNPAAITQGEKLTLIAENRKMLKDCNEADDDDQSSIEENPISEEQKVFDKMPGPKFKNEEPIKLSEKTMELNNEDEGKQPESHQDYPDPTVKIGERTPIVIVSDFEKSSPNLGEKYISMFDPGGIFLALSFDIDNVMHESKYFNRGTSLSGIMAMVEKNSLRVTSPDSIKGNHDSAMGNFGIPQYGGSMAGTVVYPNNNKKGYKSFDDFGISFKAGAGAMPNFVLVDRGDCFFALKVWNAQNAGAAAVLVADDIDEALITNGVSFALPSDTAHGSMIITSSEVVMQVPTLSRDGDDRIQVLVFLLITCMTSILDTPILKLRQRFSGKTNQCELHFFDIDIYGQAVKVEHDFKDIQIWVDLFVELGSGDYEVKMNKQKLRDGELAKGKRREIIAEKMDRVKVLGCIDLKRSLEELIASNILKPCVLVVLVENGLENKWILYPMPPRPPPEPPPQICQELKVTIRYTIQWLAIRWLEDKPFLKRGNVTKKKKEGAKRRNTSTRRK